MADLGFIPETIREPFQTLFNQGTIKLNGSKMSKSKGNLVRPETFLTTVGADALRLFHLFQAPPGDPIEWRDTDIEGPSRFLKRFWRLAAETSSNRRESKLEIDNDIEFKRHEFLEAVGKDYEEWGFNRIVARSMEFSNELIKYSKQKEGPNAEEFRRGVEALTLVLAPMAPHITAEIGERFLSLDVHAAKFPTPDLELLAESEVTLVVQVDGKFGDKFKVRRTITEDDALLLATVSERVQDRLGNRRQASASG
jgi:leucyl-tRNA synthetase